MIHRLLFIAFGTLTLMSFSPSTLAARGKENGPPTHKEVKTEQSRESQKISLFFSLPHSLISNVANFLPPTDVLQLAQASKYFLSTAASQLNVELSLEDKELTEKDFLKYFGKDGIYKEAQYLSLSGSSFHPNCLRLLPKTLKALKLKNINTKRFEEFRFESKSTFLINMFTALAETLDNLKFLDISENKLGVEEARSVAQLTKLTSLNISENKLGDEGARIIAEHLSALTHLDIYKNRITAKGAHTIAELLPALTHLDISVNDIGNKGAHHLANLKSLTFLDISLCVIGNDGASHLAGLKSLTHLNISWNEIGEAGEQHLREQLPLCEIEL